LPRLTQGNDGVISGILNGCFITPLAQVFACAITKNCIGIVQFVRLLNKWQIFIHKEKPIIHKVIRVVHKERIATHYLKSLLRREKNSWN